MATRLTEAEKGKQQITETSRNKTLRIKAPNFDNSALIEANKLTLIGRLTNPREQKMWALLPSLPRKWNLLGKAVGSDLGNNCFQYRFEREEDLRRVLNNRPYHFAYWMVILQRWEPIISNSFPSQIPFWIRVKGLPLHYWHADMLDRVGRELGTIDNHELTRTTTRLRVFVDGLKPLIKESIVEYDSGEECLVTFEYERLELHCSICYSLLHSKDHCPEKETARPDTPHLPNLRTERELEGQRYIIPSNRSLSRNSTGQDITRNSQKQTRDSPGRTGKVSELGHKHHAFEVRLDRHGNPFGNRVSTKQTRNPPPENATLPKANSTLAWREKPAQEQTQDYTSPPYTKNRSPNGRSGYRNRDLFPQQPSGYWKPRTTNPNGEATSKAPVQKVPTTYEISPPGKTTLRVEESSVPTMEEVMEELHDVTRQYLSCPDPVEAAARRQRVQIGDAAGQMEETASAIIAAATRRQQKQALLSWEREVDNDPVTPPPLQTDQLQDILLPDPSVLFSPSSRVPKEREHVADHRKEASREDQSAPTEMGPAKLKSIVVSPLSEKEADQSQKHKEKNACIAEVENLKEPQAKTQQQKAPSVSKTRSPRYSPNILSGVSSKKRKLSQFQYSPGGGARNASGQTSQRRKKTATSDNAVGAALQPTNPPIQLIPATSKRKSDFRVPPPPGP
ncbi:uncharacterized protein LOC108815195 [Raphanus sativus]|uniref:Uncharacterized protein LOC108815195 n=1 Tax=Raphanus sativus TaxID=3726 RepID=A0A6J0K792_RAPSA|nr:uncharacterized protein LOC108815195 [Raphanus sativus]